MPELIPPDLIPLWIPGETTIDSSAMNWNGIALKGYRYTEQEAVIPPMRDYMIVVYRGDRATMRRRNGGPWTTATVERGVISLLTRAEASTWHWDGPIEVRHMYLSHDVLETTALQVFEREPKALAIDDHVRSEDETIPQLLQLLELELNGAGVGERLYVDAIRTQLAVRLLRSYARIEVAHSGVGGLGGALRRAVIDYVGDNLSKSIKLDELAAEVGLSAFHFSRKFKSEFGVLACCRSRGQAVKLIPPSFRTQPG